MPHCLDSEGGQFCSRFLEILEKKWTIVSKAYSTENILLPCYFFMLKSCLLKPIGTTSHLHIFKIFYPFGSLWPEVVVLG